MKLYALLAVTLLSLTSSAQAQVTRAQYRNLLNRVERLEQKIADNAEQTVRARQYYSCSAHCRSVDNIGESHIDPRIESATGLTRDLAVRALGEICNTGSEYDDGIDLISCSVLSR